MKTANIIHLAIIKTKGSVIYGGVTSSPTMSVTIMRLRTWTLRRWQMSIKYRLQEYKWIMQNIQKLEDRKLTIETTLQRATRELTPDKVQTTRENDKWTDLIAEKLKIEKIINKEIEKGYKEMTFIEETIEKLPEKEKLLMRLRYIDCLKWEEICVHMGYEWRQIHYIHSAILRKLGCAKREKNKSLS